MTGNSWSCIYYEHTLKIQLENFNIEEQQIRNRDGETCLENLVVLDVKNCSKTEFNKSTQVNQLNVNNKGGTGTWIVFMLLIILMCIGFITELVLLILLYANLKF
jgi:hypothetical protein